MLVTGDRKVPVVEGEVATGETPPPYESSPYAAPHDSHTPIPPETSGDSSNPRYLQARPRPPNIPAMNYTRIKRKNASIKGTYVIDAGLVVPEELLSTPEADESACGCCDDNSADESGVETRKNLHLECINSSITAEVWLVDDDSGEPQAPDGGRAELEVKSKNGSLNLKLRSISGRPFTLIAKAKNASATVALPSDFVGPVTLSTVNGSVSLSNPMQSQLVTFSEENGTRKCFVGDYRRANYTGKQSWSGSMAEIGSVNGKVKLSFVDEVEEIRSNSTGFWGRLFGG